MGAVPASSPLTPHGRIAHLYDGCRHPDCLALRQWLLRSRPVVSRERRAAGASWAERSTWHLRKPARRATR